jgi:2-oxoisovalerate dehydrogenase E1 component
MMQSAVAAVDDPNSHARQMPSHFGHLKLNIVSQSSPTGTQVLQAVGCAEAGRLYSRIEGIPDADRRFVADELVYVSLGDGTTSQGEFWEGLSTACVESLPVLFHVEDNEYAISVPVEKQTPGGSISALVRSFPGLAVYHFDGTDPVESWVRAGQAVAGIREGRGPALLHSRVTRPYSHSLSDDHRSYRTAAELEEEDARDCLRTFTDRLIRDGVAEEAELDRIREECVREVKQAAMDALDDAKPEATVESAERHLYSPTVDPAGPEFDSPPTESGPSESVVGLINACLRDEMARDPRIVVFGEDVADASRPEVLEEVKGKGS